MPVLLGDGGHPRSIHIARDRPHGWRRAGAFGLIFLPQFVVYSGAGLIAILLVWWACQERSWIREPRRFLAPAVVAAAAAAFVAYALCYLLRRLWHAGPSGLGGELPLVLGFSKAPPGSGAITHQVSQLLGFHALGWWIPSGLVEGASVAAAALALVFLALRGPPSGRILALSLSAIPLFVFALAPIANLICVRYYLYAAVPLTWAVVFAVRRAGESMRRPALRRLPACVLGAVVAASLATGFIVRTDSPLNRLAETVRHLGITDLAIDPPRWTPFIGSFFELWGVEGIQVREASLPGDSEAAPEWVFRKDPRWTWPDPRKPPPLPAPEPAVYEEVAAFESLKRYDFHGDRVVDRLFHRRDRSRRPTPMSSVK